MRKLTTIVAIAAALTLVGGASAALADDAPLEEVAATTLEQNEGVCPDLDTGHESAGDATTFEVVAPAGFLVAEVCVKAGSIKQGNGPETFPVPAPVASVLISHTSGKEISHWSARFVEAPPVVPEQPADIVTSVPVDAVDCEARTVTTTTTTTTTSHALVDNVWVPSAPVVTTSSATREATEAECPIVVAPTPQVCVPAGDWYTEGDDAAPVPSDAGLVFTGGSGDAVGYRVPTTGNLQGWAPVSYDAAGATDVFYFRIVIDASADGGASYSSLTVTSGSPVTLDSIAYSNKLGASHTLAEFAELYPNAAVTSVGFHLDSAASADDVVTLAGATGPCADVDFTAEPPVVEPPVVTPPVVTPPAVVEPAPLAVVTPTSADALAETGFDLAPVAIAAAAGLVLGGGILWLAAATRSRKVEPAKHRAVK